MRIDLPGCDFVHCKHYITDGNCANKKLWDKCTYQKLNNLENKIEEIIEELQENSGIALEINDPGVYAGCQLAINTIEEVLERWLLWKHLKIIFYW